MLSIACTRLQRRVCMLCCMCSSACQTRLVEVNKRHGLHSSGAIRGVLGQATAMVTHSSTKR